MARKIETDTCDNCKKIVSVKKLVDGVCFECINDYAPTEAQVNDQIQTAVDYSLANETDEQWVAGIRTEEKRAAIMRAIAVEYDDLLSSAGSFM